MDNKKFEKAVEKLQEQKTPIGVTNTGEGLYIPNYSGLQAVKKTDPAIGTGGGQWTTSGANIYYETGNVGIGVVEPLSQLHVYATPTSATSGAIISTSGALLKTPNVDADDLVINGAVNGGMNILSSTSGNIMFGDGASSSIGKMTYNHGSDWLQFAAGGLNKLLITVNGSLEMPNAVDTTPTLTYSGALFISGGGLWYKGFSNNYKELAGA
jgi:hypothetical protein